MKRKGLGIVALLVLCTALSGCGKGTPSLLKKSVDKNTLLVLEDGQVQNSIVEEFNESYYDQDELKSFMEEAIETYNKDTAEDSVEMKKFKVDNKQAKAVMIYKTVKDYATFNDTTVKVISTGNALKSDEMPVTFKEVNDNKEVTKELALSNQEAKVLITDQADYNIMIEGTITHVSNGTVLDDNTVQAGKTGTTIIVYEQ
ncbi:hypothetical protein lbkm_3990 [Lachnospiraceae bacterium KM106-2]|nr:hypothetical protein lbkm_3990 [Lachnospiraceae bacterium KM106-2]